MWHQHRTQCDACMRARAIVGRHERRENGREDEDPLVAIDYGYLKLDGTEDGEMTQNKLLLLVANVEAPKCTKGAAEGYLNDLTRSSENHSHFFMVLHTSLGHFGFPFGGVLRVLRTRQLHGRTCCRYTRGRFECTHRGVLIYTRWVFQRATQHTPQTRPHTQPHTTTATANNTTTHNTHTHTTPTTQRRRRKNHKSLLSLIVFMV